MPSCSQQGVTGLAVWYSEKGGSWSLVKGTRAPRGEMSGKTSPVHRVKNMNSGMRRACLLETSQR